MPAWSPVPVPVPGRGRPASGAVPSAVPPGPRGDAEPCAKGGSPATRSPVDRQSQPLSVAVRTASALLRTASFWIAVER